MSETTPRPVPQYELKSLKGAVRNVDVSRKRVTGYFNAFNNFDSQGDVVLPGAFKKSIKENGPDGANRVMHLWQHDPGQPLAKPEVLKEDSYGLYFESAFPDTQLANDVVKLYEAGILTEHSIGFQTVKDNWLDETTKDGIQKREILEVKLWEGSTVTWGANSNALYTGFKGLFNETTKEDELAAINDKLTKLDNILHNGDLSDETCITLDLLSKQLTAYLSTLALTTTQEPVDTTPTVDDEPQQDNELKQLLQLRDLILKA